MLAGVSRSTVQRTLRIYAAKGLAGIRSFGWKGQPSPLTPHAATIEEEFLARPPHTAHEATRRIEELTGVLADNFRSTAKCVRYAAISAVPIS